MHVRCVSLLLVSSCLGLLSVVPASGQASRSEWPPAPPELAVERLGNLVRVAWLQPMAGPDIEGIVEIAFGYTVDVPRGSSANAVYEAARLWLLRSVPARSAELIAHLGGGQFEIVGDNGLTGLRLRVAEEHVNAVVEQAARFLNQRLVEGDLLDYVLDVREGANGGRDLSQGDRAAEVVTSALLRASGVRVDEDTEAMSEPEAAAIVEFFRQHMGTDRAWLILSTPPSAEHRRGLGEIVARTSSVSRLAAAELESGVEGDLRLESQPEGGFVIGSRVSGVHFEGWFNTLVVDRALRRRLGVPTELIFGPSRGNTVHRVERAVRFPGYPRDEAAEVMSEIAALDTALLPASLAEIKQDALAYLGSRPILEWFIAEDLWGMLEAGWTRIWNMTSEEFSSSVGAFVREPRIMATWDPAVAVPSVVVEELGESLEPEVGRRPVRIAPGRVDLLVLNEEPAPPRVAVAVERLASGVALAAGPPAVFVSGPFEAALPGGEPEVGPNGTLWSFAQLPAPGVFLELDEVRPDRLLFFVPDDERVRFREVLRDWSSGQSDATDSTGVGRFATSDLPALVILKVWLDRKVIEAGWSGEVDVRIAGTYGSRLSVTTDEGRRAEIDAWLAGASDVFEGTQGQAQFRQLRAAAGAYFDQIRQDLEILLRQRAPDGRIPPPESVSFSRFRDLLEVYF